MLFISLQISILPQFLKTLFNAHTRKILNRPTDEILSLTGTDVSKKITTKKLSVYTVHALSDSTNHRIVDLSTYNEQMTNDY